LEGQVVVTYCIPACVFLISQYGESVSIIILSTGTPLMTSKFSIVLSEQPLIPALHHTPQSQCPQNVTGSFADLLPLFKHAIYWQKSQSSLNPKPLQPITTLQL
jgi:hypothetical protein